MSKPAILLMSFGMPSDVKQLTSYCKRIQHGQFPHEKVVKRLAQRYEMLGGIDYFATIAYQQGVGVAAKLHQLGVRCPISLGFLHTRPSIQSQVRALASDGVTDIYGLPMSPYYSNLLTEDYHRKVTATLKKFPGVIYHRVNGLWNQPALLSYWQDQLIAAKQRHPWQKDDTQFLFLADQGPRRLSRNDPYRHSVELNARRISHMLDITWQQYEIGWVQSSLMLSGAVSLPKNLKLAVTRQAQHGAKNIVVVPIGFLSDSLLLDYDVRVLLGKFVKDLGSSMVQLPVPNAGPDLVKAVAQKLIFAMDQYPLAQAEPAKDVDETKKVLAR